MIGLAHKLPDAVGMIKMAADNKGDAMFWLWDLRVETISTDAPMVCNHPAGSYFLVEGENIVMGEHGSFPMYALSAILPLLPAKQRPTQDGDWMTTDAEVACPDPHCGGRFRITRTGKRDFRHSQTTGLPDTRSTPYWMAEQNDDP